MSEFLKRQEEYKLLSAFNNQLETTNKICRDDIVSLEDLLGSNLITSHRHLSFFTISKSSIGLLEAKKILRERINTVSLIMLPSQTDLQDAFELFLSKVKSQFFPLFTSLNKIPKSIIDGIQSKELNLRYTDDNILYNLRESNESIFQIFYRDKNYLLALLKLREHIDNEEQHLNDFDNIYNTIDSMLDGDDGEPLNVFNKGLTYILPYFLTNIITKSKYVEEHGWLESCVIPEIEEPITSITLDIDNFINLVNISKHVIDQKNDFIRSVENKIGKWSKLYLSQEDLNQTYNAIEKFNNTIDDKFFKCLSGIVNHLG